MVSPGTTINFEQYFENDSLIVGTALAELFFFFIIFHQWGDTGLQQTKMLCWTWTGIMECL